MPAHDLTIPFGLLQCNLKGQRSLATLVSYPFQLQPAPSSIPILQKAGPQQLGDHTDKW